MSNLIQKFSTLFKSPPPFEEPSLSSNPQQAFSADDQNRLKILFDTLDSGNSVRISHRDIENTLLLRNIKLADKSSYQKFYDHDLDSLKSFTFNEFLCFLSDLNFSRSDIWKLTCFNISLADFPVQTKDPKSLQAKKDDRIITSPEISTEKQNSLHDAFQQFDKRRTGKLEVQDIKELAASKGIQIREDDIQTMFEELDLNDNKTITFDSLLSSQRTKKGTLAMHNLLVIAKRASVNQDYASQIINLQDYSNATHLSKQDLLDLFQDFDLLDVDGSTVIKKDLLTEYETKLKARFSPEETDAYKLILGLPSSQVNFNQFISLFQNNIIPSRSFFTISKKFNNCWISQNNSKTSSQTNILLDEEKSPLYSTNESFQSSLAGKFSSLDQISNVSKIPGSLRSVSDPDLNQSDRIANKIEQVEKPGSLQDEIDLKSPSTGAGTNVGTTKIPSVQLDDHQSQKPGNGLRVESRLLSNDDFLESGQDKSSTPSSNLPYSLGSLGDVEGETEKSGGQEQKWSREILTIQKHNSILEDENERLKIENEKLKEDFDAKESELIISKEQQTTRIAQLEDELTMQDNLVSRIKKEEEYAKEKLIEANEEIADLRIKIDQTTVKFKKAGQETSQMKKKVAEKVKEVLMQKEKIDANERLLNDKTREVEAMIRRKVADEKVYNDNIAKMKGKLNYLTQKFTEYLTQNTNLQSELHQRNSAIKKMEAAFKDHMERTEDQKSQLDLKIAELEKQILQTRSKSPEIRSFPFSPSDSHQKLFERLQETLKVNSHLNQKCEEMKRESALMKDELKAKLAQREKNEDFAQTLAEQSSMVDSLTGNLETCKLNKDIARSLIESLRIQLEESKAEKTQLESKVQKMGDDLGAINMENIDLMSQVKEYKIELNYLHECLNESLCNSTIGSNDLMVNQNHERVEDLIKNQLKTIEPSKELTVMSNHDIKENIEILQHYIELLKQWEEQSRSLEESVMKINDKIQTLEGIETSKILKEEEAKKTLFDVYKKVVENKQLEANNLRRRLKEKTGIVTANIRMLSKLEATFSVKLQELSEETASKEKLIVQNNRLTQTLLEKNLEIERLRKELTESRSIYSTPKSTADPNKVTSSAFASSHKMYYSSIGKSERSSSKSNHQSVEKNRIEGSPTREKHDKKAAIMAKKLAGLEDKMNKFEKGPNEDSEYKNNQENIPNNI